MPPKTILAGSPYDPAAAIQLASLTAAAAAGQNGNSYTTIAVLEDPGDIEIDVEAVTSLLSAPDASVFIRDLQALEGQALNLFSIESGALPGVLRESKLGSAIKSRCNLTDFSTGRLLVLLCSIFTIMGAATNLSSLTSKKAVAHYTALSSGQKPQGYSAQAAFFAGAVIEYGV